MQANVTLPWAWGWTCVLALSLSNALGQEIPDDKLIFQPPVETNLVGRELPNLDLVTAAGTPVLLADVGADQPIFLTLVFSRCAGICSPYLGLLKKTVTTVGGSGRQYQMVVVSFDMRDAQSDLLALAAYHQLQDDRGWIFAAPKTEADRDRLCQALDFDYRWDETRQQYDHPAMTVAIRQGKIVRLSVGEEISPARFREMLAEARGEYVPIYPDPGSRGALFRCFDYDPQRGFTPNWGMLILVAPAAVTLLIVVCLFWFATRTMPRPAILQDQSRLAMPTSLEPPKNLSQNPLVPSPSPPQGSREQGFGIGSK